MSSAEQALVDVAREAVLEGFHPRYGEMADQFPTHPLWRRMRELGSHLWLDTGDLDAAGELWDQSFGALTTNNTLLNREVQKGVYDDLIRTVAAKLRRAVDALEPSVLIRELAFILNAYHGLRLVERFDAFVSVELHTDLAFDREAAIDYARRFHAICRERFIVKIPLTADGLLAAGQLSREGVPINFTLGFSARQNVLIGALANPAYCNVFLGRLNQVVAENGLGDGRWVGERAVAASQQAIRDLRKSGTTRTRQIAASLRGGHQIESLAGVDVLTMPPKVAAEFLQRADGPLEAGINGPFEPQWAEIADPATCAVDTLWSVPPGLAEAAADLAAGGVEDLTGSGLQRELAERGFGDILPRREHEDLQRAAAGGKIPDLSAWRYRLAAQQIGLDAIMTMAGLMSFAADQAEMDDRIRQCLTG